jgi:hypothetical protein
MNVEVTSLYFGLRGIDPQVEVVDLGGGLLLRKTYAHLIGAHVLAFAQPASPNTHHPGPWQATTRNDGIDVRAELEIPFAAAKAVRLRPQEVARVVVTLIHFFTEPNAQLVLLTPCPLASLPQRPVNDAPVAHVLSVQPEWFTIGRRDAAAPYKFGGVRDTWQAACALFASSPKFRLAIEAFDLARFVPTALGLVALWGALEALFCDSQNEITFKLSTFIAAYLEPPGQDRCNRQKRVAKLYGKRSLAAHGKPKHAPDDLLESCEIMRACLLRMIQTGRVPTKTDLESALYIGNMSSE